MWMKSSFVRFESATLAPVVAILLAALVWPAAALAEITRPVVLGGFEVHHEVTVPGTPEEVFDAFAAEIGVWWDQRYRDDSKAVAFELRLGGGFYEVYDDAGNGARHATIDYLERGKRIRFTGPMGFSGYAVEMVHTVDFNAGGSAGTTRVDLTVRGAGQMDPDWPAAVDRTWHHLLIERFKLYVEAKQAALKQQQQPQEPSPDDEPGGE